MENNNRRIKILEEMAQRIYREWFVEFRYPGHQAVPLVASELGPIPEGWSIRRLDEDPRLIDPPEDEDGVYIIRSGSNPALRETMDAIWAEDNGVAVVEELLAQLLQLAEDDLGVAAVHEVWEQITNYER